MLWLMTQKRLTLLSLIATLSVLVVAPLAADARNHTATTVRDGFYAGITPGSHDLVFLHVKHRRVCHLRFNLTLACHDSSTGADYGAAFSAGSAMPQGKKIPANGRLQINWTQNNGARDGRISSEIDFHRSRHLLASFSVISSGAIENCDSFAAIAMSRSPKTPPIPPGP